MCVNMESLVHKLLKKNMMERITRSMEISEENETGSQGLLMTG